MLTLRDTILIITPIAVGGGMLLGVGLAFISWMEKRRR